MLLAIVYAKIVEEHPVVADLELIDRCVRHPEHREPDPRPGRERSFRQEADGWTLAVLDFWHTCDHRDGVPGRQIACLTMAPTIVHILAADLQLDGSHEATGDVFYLSAPGNDKRAPVQETREGHAGRLDDHGRVTHLTAVNARWLLERDGELVATLRDGRQLRLGREDVTGIVV